MVCDVCSLQAFRWSLRHGNCITEDGSSVQIECFIFTDVTTRASNEKREL